MIFEIEWRWKMSLGRHRRGSRGARTSTLGAIVVAAVVGLVASGSTSIADETCDRFTNPGYTLYGNYFPDPWWGEEECKFDPGGQCYACVAQGWGNDWVHCAETPDEDPAFCAHYAEYGDIPFPHIRERTQ